MSDVGGRGDYDAAELAGLLQRSANSFATVRVTYRVWSHNARLTAAFAAHVKDQTRRGVATATVSARSEVTVSAEREETITIWRAGDRLRQEHQSSDWRDGAYGVRHREVWWSWDSWMGSITNDGDPRHQSYIGVELAMMLDPSVLVDVVDFSVIARSVVAGRATHTVQATALAAGSGSALTAVAVHRLGTGADHYMLEIDCERGVLMEATAVRNGEPFRRVAATEIEFDHPIPPERFVFEPPNDLP